MHTVTQLLLSAPVPIVVTAVVLRYGPSAVVVLVAGLAAALVPGRRGARALAVLRLMHTTTAQRARVVPHPGAITGQPARPTVTRPARATTT
ncbi:hypothetical protein AB0I60_09125 [Actinosynnema sp. NPDC050436]|uniref:hypothetical protein n=1 Tax=Actinosynnema sp. NPDC050436 TaxID=3155659 RepID=UPI0033C23BFD